MNVGLAPTAPIAVLAGESLPEAQDVHSSPCKGEVGRAATGRGSQATTRFDHTSEKTARARRLRREMTDVEKKLWWRLRGAQLGVSFRRQHPIGPYVLDFYCAPAGLAVEVDGHQHGTDSAIAADVRRSAFLATKGIRVVRFGNHEVIENLDGVLETIWRALQVGSREEASL